MTENRVPDNLTPENLYGALTRFVCHKQVGANKITGVAPLDEDAGTVEIILGYRSTKVPISTFSRRWPSVGDYLVVYEDGYISLSPAKVFEDGYSPVLPYEHVEYANGRFAGGRGPQPRTDCADGSPAIKVNGVPVETEKYADGLPKAARLLPRAGLSPVTYRGVELDKPAPPRPAPNQPLKKWG